MPNYSYARNVQIDTGIREMPVHGQQLACRNDSRSSGNPGIGFGGGLEFFSIGLFCGILKKIN